MNPTLFVLVTLGAPYTDCGAERLRKAIDQTESEIVARAPLILPKSVAPGPTTTECVRLEFDVTPRGRPINVEIVEASGSNKFALAAREALRLYEFRPGKTGAPKTLVISGEVD